MIEIVVRICEVHTRMYLQQAPLFLSLTRSSVVVRARIVNLRTRSQAFCALGGNDSSQKQQCRWTEKL